MINEIDRFKKEKGRDYDVLKDRGLDLDAMSSEKISKEKEKEKEPASGESKDNELDLKKIEKEKIDSGAPRYYFNMSSEFELTAGGGERIAPAKRVTQKGKEQFTRYSSPSEKVKITPMAVANPKAEYDTTPMGYYGYPLTRDFIEAFKKQRLPYMQGSTLLTIVEAIDPDGLMLLDDIEATRAYIKLKNDAFTVTHTSGDKIRAPNAFAKSLLNRNPSVTWVYDPGDGTIYRSEPCQVVFLTSKAFRVVDKLSAKAVFESLTGGEEKYRTEEDPNTIDPKILMTLKHTKDPAVVVKLAKHPQEKVRELAMFHPLAPKELFNKEIDRTFVKLKTSISPENILSGEFESAATKLGMTLRGVSGGDRTIVYNKLVELMDEIPSETRSNVELLYGLDAILEGLSKSGDESLSMRMMEDLAANRIIFPVGYQSASILDGAISRIAKENIDNEKLISKYLELVTGKQNSTATFLVFLDIMDYAEKDTEALKAVKAVASSKSIPPSGKVVTRVYEIIEGISKKRPQRGTEGYNVFLDTLEAIITSKNVNRQTFSLAKIVISQLEEDAKNA